MSVALAWEQAGGMPAEVSGLIGPGAETLLAIPEHKVALPGRGYPSQCDVFALARSETKTFALTIEAKVLEPFDKPLIDWLGPNPSDGKQARLRGICSLLGKDQPPASLRYQLLHRTAAAVIEAKRFGTDAAAMIVQSFDPHHAWFEDYRVFCDWLGLSAAVGTSASYILPDGRPLKVGWASSAVPHQ